MIGQVPNLTSLKRRPDELKIPRLEENEENETSGREVQSSQRKKNRNVPDLLSGMSIGHIRKNMQTEEKMLSL